VKTLHRPNPAAELGCNQLIEPAEFPNARSTANGTLTSVVDARNGLIAETANETRLTMPRKRE